MQLRSAPFTRVLFALLLASAVRAQTNLRAWSAHGQTWLVWEDDHALGASNGVDTYSIHRAPHPIADVTGTALAGRLFAADWNAHRLNKASPGSTFTIPDGAGGTYTLAPNEALFVYTAHTSSAEHFAVVRTGDSAPPPGAVVGPLAPSTAPVRAHAQLSGMDAGHPYTVYAHWLDGQADPSAGTAQYPVMTTEHAHGTARVFAVFEPLGGLPAGPTPATVFLHGSGGSYWKFRPSNGGAAGFGFDSSPSTGLLVTLDDAQAVYSDVGGTPAVKADFSTFWFGTVQDYDRFASPALLPADDAVVADYDLRRIDFVLDWLIDERGVDAQHIRLGGLSNGGRGALAYLRSRPERIAAALCFVPGLAPEGSVTLPAATGTVEQDLATTLPSGIGLFSYLNPATSDSSADLPYVRAVWGVNDTQVPWSSAHDDVLALEATRRGWHLEWDERAHTSGAGWAGAHFVGSPRHDLQSLDEHRADRSFPAFYDVDHDLGTPGAQPEAQLPAAPLHGSRGGWIDWFPASVSESASSWSVDLDLRTNASFAGDNAPAPTARLSLVPRRTQSFELLPHQVYGWSLRDPLGALLQTGAGVADAAGLPAIEGLLLDGTRATLRVEAVPASWQVLGAGSPGSAGVPELSSTSSLQPNTPLQLELNGAAPSSPCFLVIGASELHLPLLGGTLVPFPLALLPGATDPDGRATWTASTPPNFASGQSLVFQAWVLDPASALGASSSAGLRGSAL